MLKKMTGAGVALLTLAGTAFMPTGASAQVPTWTPLTSDFLTNPPPEAWPSKRRDPFGWGYSPLDQITRDNVGNLELAFVLETGVAGGNEGTPAVANGVMFFQAQSTRVIAANATNGNVLWVYNYTLLPQEQRAALGVGGNSVNRGLVLYDNMVLAHFGDSHIVAINAETGQEMWKTFTDGQGYTSPGIMAGNILVSGNRAKNNDRGFVTGIDVTTGEILWQTYVIPGPGEPGYETWEVPGTAERGHGSVWGSPTYDPALDLVYVTVGNPDPYTNQTRPGDNLYVQSVIAMRPGTGEIVWHHQFIPNDSWDQDSVMEAVLFDAEIDGVMRHLMVHTGKSGFTNLLDRETGEWLDYMFTAYQNIFLDVDAEGHPVLNEELVPRPGVRVIACPSTRGGTDWPARSYSPDTGLYYISGNHVCMDVEGVAYNPGDPNRNIDDFRVRAPGYDYIGELWAIDPVAMEVVWSVKYDLPTSAIPLPTAGGVVFAGGIDRTFRAYDDATGALLWEHPVNAPIEGHPISYAVDGVQYVAVPTGCCTLVGGAITNELIPGYLAPSGTQSVWVFRLAD